ncbi:MAG: hypothetical protein P8170_18900 [Gemmatimonadota bacterium]
MGPEVWVIAAAVFFSGGAVGAAGTLLAQWIVGKVGRREAPTPNLGTRETALLRAEVAGLALKLDNLDARVDFQEQLLGGALETTPPPPRRPSSGVVDEETP